MQSPPRTIRHMPALAVPAFALLLVFGGSIAEANPYYDPKGAATNIAHGCKDIALVQHTENVAPRLDAKCNQCIDRVCTIKVVSASIELADGIGFDTSPTPQLTFNKTDTDEGSCVYWQIDVRSDGMYLRAECPEGGTSTKRVVVPWLKTVFNLKWDINNGKFVWS